MSKTMAEFLSVSSLYLLENGVDLLGIAVKGSLQHPLHPPHLLPFPLPFFLFPFTFTLCPLTLQPSKLDVSLQCVGTHRAHAREDITMNRESLLVGGRGGDGGGGQGGWRGEG